MTANPSTGEIALARPDITQQEIDAVVAVLRTPHLSLGPKVPEFEARFAKLCQTKHAVACNSGTSALHMVVRALGLGPDDEVITTPFSFVASANCILFERARPVLVDIDPATWCIDPSRIEVAITPRTKALIPVDVFGATADMDPINAIARKHKLRVIEDSCEAAGATYKGRPAGSLGDAGVFGFYPNKQITTGEGGMVVTNDDEIARLCRSIRNQGRGTTGTWLAHERLGYNFRLSDVNCAMGIVQVDRLAEIVASRSRAARMYDERLSGDKRLRGQVVTPGCEKSWFVYVVCLSDEYTAEHRDRIMAGLKAAGIGCNNYFSPIHLQPFYQEDYGFKLGDFPVCERVAARTIALPFHAFLSEADVDRVVKTLRGLL
jgi:perosamine synthetase